MALRIDQVTIDRADPERLAAFWAAALGDRPEVEKPGQQVWPENPAGKATKLL